MTRQTLAKILEAAEGIAAADGGRYEVADKHRVTFYIGRPGQAMAVSEVAACALEDDFVRVVTREHGTSLFVEYDAVHAVADRPPKDREERRAGFS